ncbi:MAG: hypothetical protein HUJ51_05075 [Eggerthellaceae bacterium]|nr:hypothetical protein [Eggerthellaceae bacterium]
MPAACLTIATGSGSAEGGAIGPGAASGGCDGGGTGGSMGSGLEDDAYVFNSFTGDCGGRGAVGGLYAKFQTTNREGKNPEVLD